MMNHTATAAQSLYQRLQHQAGQPDQPTGDSPPVYTPPTLTPPAAWAPASQQTPEEWLETWWPEYHQTKYGTPPDPTGGINFPPGVPHGLWGQWPYPDQPELHKIRLWVERQITGEYGPDTGIGVQGPFGSGKTSLAGAAWKTIWPAKQHQPPTGWQNTRQLVHRLINAPTRQDRQRTLNHYTKIPYLMLDDLGAEPAREWETELVCELIEARYDRQLATSATTNLNREARRERYGGRTADRLDYLTIWVPIVSTTKRTPKTLD